MGSHLHPAALRGFWRLLSVLQYLPTDLLTLGVEHGREPRLNEGPEQVGDGGDVVIAHLPALGAKALPHLAPERGGVDQLDEAPALLGFPVGDDPDVSGDARVVEHVRRQGDDRLDEIILQQVPSDLTLAAPSPTREQGRPVQDDAEAAPAIGSRAHLGQEVHEE